MPIFTTLGAACAKAWGFTSGLITDQYFNLVSLLLPGNGTNGAQNNTFLDSSSNTFTITRNGNTTQGTFSPFSQTGWGAYFDGVTDYVTVADAAALEPGSSDMTFETWIYPTASGQASGSCIISKSVSGGFGPFNFQQTSTNTLNLLLSTGGTTWDASFATTATVNINQWNHVAFTRSGNTFTIWINGASGATSTSITTGLVNNSQSLMFGWGNSGTTTLFQGYMSNARYVIGRAVYTSAFTPPTAPLGTTSGGQNPPTGTQTALLTFQSNRFLDNSVNTFTVTKNGDVAITPFSPFAPTQAYSASAVGGSGYFDGTGDYLSVPDNSAFTLGSGDFTVEVWVYKTTTGTQRFISAQAGSSGANTSASYTLQVNASEKIVGTINSGATNYTATSSGDCPLNTWTHIAFVRDGNTTRLYINGIQDGTGSVTGVTVNDSSDILGIGSLGAYPSLYWVGYLSNFRLVKGTCVYPNGTTFTPPTAPLTAITNTSLLLNFTNAGVVDATAKNVLETVGNAQISTTQSKWGGGSIAFDGAGDYLVPNGATTNMFAFGNGDFTIEFWIRFNALSGFQMVYDSRPSGTDGPYPMIYANNTTLIYYVGAADRISSSAISTNTWYHIAVARSGTSTKMFINGTQSGSTYTDSTNYINPANRPLIGANGTNLGNSVNGYIQDLRITKGNARGYTGSTITVPTAPFPLQ